MRRRSTIVALALLTTAVGCWSRPRPVPQPAPATEQAPPLQPIPVYELVPTPEQGIVSLSPTTRRDPLTELGATKPITLSANNASARTLLLEIASEAGVSLVVSPDVTARVSVSFTNVPASEAIRAIIAQAGLSVLTGGLRSPWPPAVFYQLPVNIDRASAETIVARFGVSAEMAKFLVETRKP